MQSLGLRLFAGPGAGPGVLEPQRASFMRRIASPFLRLFRPDIGTVD